MDERVAYRTVHETGERNPRFRPWNALSQSPLREGIPERQTHDYQRHGITTLFAALHVASGKVIGKCKDSHRHSEYISFLSLLDRRCAKGKTLHLIVDNVSSHKT